VGSDRIGVYIHHGVAARSTGHTAPLAYASEAGRRTRYAPLRYPSYRHLADVGRGADLRAASEVLGHHRPVITMRVYRPLKVDQRDLAVNLLARSLGVVDEYGIGEQEAKSS
jgi:hypothetical protein